MPYSKEHKERSRERILESAAKLFPHLGFDAVSIDQLMQEAGLTRGAFYAHFANKAEVYAASIGYAARNSVFYKLAESDCDASEWFEQTVAIYLSREHLDRAPYPCPLAFLVTDINRRDAEVRNTYTRVYKNLNRTIRQQLTDGGAGEQVLAATAMMIGGVAVARALDDRRTADRLLSACRGAVREMLEVER